MPWVQKSGLSGTFSNKVLPAFVRLKAFVSFSKSSEDFIRGISFRLTDCRIRNCSEKQIITLMSISTSVKETTGYSTEEIIKIITILTKREKFAYQRKTHFYSSID